MNKQLRGVLTVIAAYGIGGGLYLLGYYNIMWLIYLAFACAISLVTFVLYMIGYDGT
jgi:hypothetical protein